MFWIFLKILRFQEWKLELKSFLNWIKNDYIKLKHVYIGYIDSSLPSLWHPLNTILFTAQCSLSHQNPPKQHTIDNCKENFHRGKSTNKFQYHNQKFINESEYNFKHLIFCDDIFRWIQVCLSPPNLFCLQGVRKLFAFNMKISQISSCQNIHQSRLSRSGTSHNRQ